MEEELKKRLLTGLGGIAGIIVLVVFAGRVGVAIISVSLALGMMHEFADMTLTLPDKAEKRTVLLGFTWLIAFANFWVPKSEYELLITVFFILFCYFLFTAEKFKGGSDLPVHFQELALSIFGILYTGFLPIYLLLVRDTPNGMHWVLLFFLIIWATDTGAYFIGRKYGTRRLYAAMSPKKTVEGALGGLGAAWLGAVLYKVALFHEISWWGVLLAPPLVSVMSQAGDFCESFLKRAYNKKDSGNLLPGHGGLLDRFDGLLFALPAMYACVRVFGGGS